ncbi:hypothetical protein Pla111_31000 [Botrimarina hoheduenensis]|uniref:Uncharacterized protein n=1 Tax=Botrimarina hoheduenensis TaxID=2528000 RepID=A0A5C5VRX3_9BACT|nr:hypothetical protein Pla111_31000 [Botrimarina hoheduenensis]
MIFLSLLKYTGRFFRGLHNVFTLLRRFANPQSLILAPLIVILMMLPAILGPKTSRQQAPPREQETIYQQMYGGSFDTPPAE